jgi:hypothetical protein
MNKLLCPALALALTAALTGCGNSQPTPEETMQQEAMNVLRDELPLDASEFAFTSKHNVQNCWMSFDDGQSVWATLTTLPATQFPLVMDSKKYGDKWETIQNDYGNNTIESQTGGLASESLSATEFRRRVRECVELSTVRRQQMYSKSIRAANALTWAQAAESRGSMSAFGGRAIMELKDRQAVLDQRVHEFSQQVTVTQSKDGEPSITLSNGPEMDTSGPEALPALELDESGHPVTTRDLPREP